MRRFTGLSFLVVLTVAPLASAAVFYTDGFESYTAGGNPLDKNVAGPNRRRTAPAIHGLARHHPTRASSAWIAQTARQSRRTAATT